MNKSIKKIIIVQVLLIGINMSLFIGTVLFVPSQTNFLPERIASRYERVGGAKMYGYTFVNWETFMHSPQKDAYIAYIEQGLDFAFVHAQWSVVGKDGNDTLNYDYLDNLTLYIKELGAKGIQVVIHTWVSSYSAAWIYPFVPELVGKTDRWQGINPETTDPTSLEHRTTLKNSMIHYHEQLCDYFASENVMDFIYGFCLDDETQSEYWTDFFAEITSLLLTYNASWQIGSMFNRYDKYHLTGDAGMTCNYMDPYDQDPKYIQKILYAYEHAGVENISVLIDAMNHHDDVYFHNKMIRQAWIAWFMGVDSIGWYTFLYPTEEWAVLKWNGGNGPIATAKTQAALDAATDIRNLNAAYAKIAQQSNEQIKSEWMDKLIRSYSKARQNLFTQARLLLEEVLDA